MYSRYRSSGLPDWLNRVTLSGWVATQMDIGNAATDMTARMPTGTAQADGSMKVESTFDVAHVASTVVYMANLPLDTNVQFVTIMATDMPYIGRGWWGPRATSF